jgi:hypothetical protein
VHIKGKKYSGKLEWFFETGCEGVLWALEVDSDQQGGDDLAYGTIAFVDSGDYLRVTASDGTMVFDDTIRPDWYRGWTPRPSQWHWIGKLLVRIRRFTPGLLWHRLARKGYFIGQPTALGYWIHWTQQGWEPEAWARLFIRMKGEESYRAELIKAGTA